MLRMLSYEYVFSFLLLRFGYAVFGGSIMLIYHCRIRFQWTHGMIIPVSDKLHNIEHNAIVAKTECHICFQTTQVFIILVNMQVNIWAAIYLLHLHVSQFHVLKLDWWRTAFNLWCSWTGNVRASLCPCTFTIHYIYHPGRILKPGESVGLRH